MSDTKPNRPARAEAHGAGGRFDAAAPTAHGEELREAAEERPGWARELETALKQLGEALARIGEKGHEKGSHGAHGAPGTVRHPLVIAALVTALITAGSSLLVHRFQEQSARHQQENELYKSKLDFIATFGDSFPRALNALYSSRKSLLWMKCYPVSYYVDKHGEDGIRLAAEAGSQKPPEEAGTWFDRQGKDYEEASRTRLQEKKPTALLAQAIALFGGAEADQLKGLLQTVRDLQNVCDDPKPPQQFEKQKYREIDARLEELHDRANTQFAAALEALGGRLSGHSK